MERDAPAPSSRFPWVILFILITASVVLAGYMAYLRERDEVIEAKRELLRAVGELKSEQIQHWRSERIGDAAVRAAESQYFRQSLHALVEGASEETEQLRQAWRLRMEIITEAYRYADVLVITPDGRNVLSVDEDPEPVTPTAQAALNTAFATGEAALSDFYLGRNGKVFIDSVAPMFDDDGVPLAALVMRANAMEHIFPILDFWPIPSRSAVSLLARIENSEVVLLDDPRDAAEAFEFSRISLSRIDLPAVQAALGLEGVFEGEDYYGVSVLADLRKIHGTSWVLVNKIAASEVAAETRRHLLAISALAALVILFAGASLGYGRRRFQAQLYKNLYRLERKERAAQEEFRTTLYSIGDAVIAASISGAVTRMNPVAEELTGWSESEAVGRPLSEVFRIVSEENRSEVENPVDRVLKEGAVVGLANHTVLISRNGTEYPIADSGAPIRNEEGEIIGVVLVFSDQTREREAERALRETEEAQRAMIDCSPLALYSFDVEGRILKWNRSAEKIFGWTEAEVVGKPVPNVPEDDRGTFTALVEKVMSGETIRGIEVTRRRKDGSPVEVRINAAPIRDDAGRIVAVMGAVEDVTEKKAAEAAVRESERFAQSALDALSSSLAILDETGVIIAVNRTWREFARQNTPSDLEFDSFDFANYLEVCDRAAERGSSDAREMARGIRAVIQGETDRFSLEYACHSPSEKRWFLVRVTRFVGDGPVRVVVNHENITDRKLSDQQLHLQSAALNAAANSIIITDREGNIEWVNPAFVEMTGYSLEEAMGRTTTDLIGSGEHDQAFYDEMWSTIRSGDTWAGEFVNRRKNGEHYHEENVITPVKNEQGELTHFVAVKQDVTDRKRLQAQFFQAQKMEAVGRLAGGVAHDFNNMLGVIIGGVELALMDLPEDSPIRKDLEDVKVAAERSADLTQQLLAFARQQTIAPRLMDLNEAVGSTLKMLGRLIGEDIDLLWKPGKDLWFVRMDPVQIDQILANLAVNARDAILGVGKMTIETCNVSIDEGYCEDNPGFLPGRYVRIGVSDNGAGMPPEVVARVFDPFFTTKPSGQGTGLGLATVYGIVKQNNGFINVYSEVGKGTTFKIYLPAVEVGEIGTGAPTTAAAPPRGSETILVVEDQEALLNLVKRMLVPLGYTVLTAATPQEAIEMVEKFGNGIHLLMTDVIMPDMSGRDVYERLVEQLPGLKCLYMSGYTADVIAHHGVLEEGIHFVQKPFSIDALAEKIREALDA